MRDSPWFLLFPVSFAGLVLMTHFLTWRAAWKRLREASPGEVIRPPMIHAVSVMMDGVCRTRMAKAGVSSDGITLNLVWPFWFGDQPIRLNWQQLSEVYVRENFFDITLHLRFLLDDTIIMIRIPGQWRDYVQKAIVDSGQVLEIPVVNEIL